MLIVYVYNKLFLGELIMKKTKMFSAMTAAAVAALSMSAVAAVPAFADDVDLDGVYHAYIGVQSASYTFRNAYDDAQYGYGTKADDGTVWFDQLTGWDGPTAVNKPTTFNDCEIAGNGTYTVSMSDFDFGDDESLNLLFVSTDIPLNDQIKVSDVKVSMDGQTKYTFDEAYMNPDATTYMNWQQINIWNEDLGKEDGLFGYTMPQDSIEIEFTISGFAYDNTDSAEAEETTAAEEETEAETTAAEETEAEASAAETEAASAPAESSSGNAGVIIAIVAVVIVAAVVVVIVIKKKNG